MGRDRAKRVSSAPRGLGLYRREGREGFFFVKNLAAAEWLGFHEMHEVIEDGELGPARYSHISGNELETEASKLLRLCWSEGFRPSQKALAEIMTRFTRYIREHAENTS